MTKWVIITGASSGIGQALAIHFSNSGYNVLAIGRNEINLQRIKSTTKNGKVVTIIADLSKEDEIDKIAKYKSLENGIHYLIHCAATTEPHLAIER
jgi:short-subunit dehydrogenase